MTTTEHNTKDDGHTDTGHSTQHCRVYTIQRAASILFDVARTCKRSAENKPLCRLEVGSRLGEATLPADVCLLRLVVQQAVILPEGLASLELASRRADCKVFLELAAKAETPQVLAHPNHVALTVMGDAESWDGQAAGSGVQQHRKRLTQLSVLEELICLLHRHGVQMAIRVGIEERFAKAKAASDAADVADAAAKEAAVAAARADAVADAAARDAAAGLAGGDDGVGKRAARRNTTRRDAAIAATSSARLARRRKAPRDSAASRSRTQLLQTDADAPAASEDSAMARESERLLQQKARRDRALVMSTLFAGVQ